MVCIKLLEFARDRLVYFYCISYSLDNEIGPKLPREYNSLREIYEARLIYQQQQEVKSKLDERQTQRQMQDRAATLDDQMEKDNNRRNNDCDCTSPLLPRHERRQRKANNQPDVVPKPPPPLPTGTTTLNDQIGEYFAFANEII